MREHNVADTCRQPLIFTARARRAGELHLDSRRREPSSLRYTARFPTVSLSSTASSVLLRLFVLSLSLSLSRARARACFFSGLLARRTSTARRKIFQRR